MKQVFTLAILLTATALVKANNNQVPNELLVIGGLGSQGITEVVNPSNFKAETTSLDLKVFGAVGFHLNGNPTVCGGLFEGKVTSKCLSLSNGPAWNETFELETPRSFSSSIQINENKALVIGGYDRYSNHLNTLETITSEGATLSSKPLPFTFWGGCATKINANEGIIIGGKQDGLRSSKTWIINLNSLDLKPGPDMKTARSNFGCATSKNKVVVGGGLDRSNFVSSTEILNTQDLTWTPGPDLRTAVYGLSMVESANGILAIGGYGENGLSKSIHRLSCNEGNECQWEHIGDLNLKPLKSIHRLSCNEGNECQWKREGKLNHGRYHFNVIPITSETTTTLEDDALLQAHFNLLTLLGYRCFKNSETSFACEKI